MTGFLWVAAASLVYLSVTSVRAQVTCENFGSPIDSSTCACPPGFGGTTCSVPACGGNIFQAGQRPLVSGASATSLGNVSTSSCACPAGWTGTRCDVCQSPTVCQSAFTAAGGAAINSQQGGPNNTLTCNTEPRVWAAGEASCAIVNPILQAVFPLSVTLTALRTLNTSLTPQPNSTSFGPSGSVYAQLWYDGIEQFYCESSSCSQDVQTSNGGVTWSCTTIRCTCRPGAAFCGGGILNFPGLFDGLSGDMTMSCDPPASAIRSASCNFKQAAVQSVFGPAGVSLTDCVFGECVRQGVIDAGGGSSSSSDSGAEPLGGGFIPGLVVRRTSETAGEQRATRREGQDRAGEREESHSTQRRRSRTQR